MQTEVIERTEEDYALDRRRNFLLFLLVVGSITCLSMEPLVGVAVFFVAMDTFHHGIIPRALRKALATT